MDSTRRSYSTEPLPWQCSHLHPIHSIHSKDVHSSGLLSIDPLYCANHKKRIRGILTGGRTLHCRVCRMTPLALAESKSPETYAHSTSHQTEPPHRRLSFCGRNN
ncbi:hypothetical protein K402DRAFT_248248 [Aulographum hederae CBS 113979]|uniref:Uncharacterized protein n=1 Tax=Aulographum hederae CBS 113979 TaxID=1176131 RepID=A0A6G1HA66_9PEZI|nr:hypothetical protein K402DRAFT_248248 [Aulographum hederae CBS 113979]